MSSNTTAHPHTNPDQTEKTIETDGCLELLDFSLEANLSELLLHERILSLHYSEGIRFSWITVELRTKIMSRPASAHPTEVELQILRILWESEPLTARQIHNSLSTDRQTNYSTTVKMLAVMFDKGLVTRDESVSPILFSSASTQEATQQSVLKDVIQKLYDGSAKSLMLHALSSQKASQEDLAEIRALIEQLDAQQVRTPIKLSPKQS